MVFQSVVDVVGDVLDHADAGRVEAELRAAGVHVVDASYGANGVVLTVAGRDIERLASTTAALTAGRARARAAGEILSEEHTGEGTRVSAKVDEDLHGHLTAYAV